MPEKERNALAELANEMSWIENILCYEGYSPYIADANKASRIISELAKVSEGRWVEDFGGKFYLCRLESRVVETAVGKCRAIAEEGAEK